MTDFYIELTNQDFTGDSNADPLEYHFPLMNEINERHEINSTTTEANPVEISQHTAINYKNARVQISWLMYDQGDDKSSGTYNSAGISDARITSTDGGNTIVKTPVEQKVFLKKYLFINNLGAQWRLHGGEYTYDWDSNSAGTEGIPVTIERCPMRRINNRPQVIVANLELKIGQRV